MESENELHGELPQSSSGETTASSSESSNRCGDAKPPVTELNDPTKSPESRATGPRTKIGKEHSRLNAMTYGLYSSAVVLKDESQEDYNKLLAGLRNARKPEGELEELLVEKLATLAWRYRRVLWAEGAEIRKNKELRMWDQMNQKLGLTVSIEGPEKYNGLIGKITDPDVLRHCLEMLTELAAHLETRGFNPDEDGIVLCKLYGDRDPDVLRKDLYDEYESWRYTSKANEEKRTTKGYASPEECLLNVLEATREEIVRLEIYARKWTRMERTRVQIEIAAGSVPDAPALDRLLRAETNLSREFARTLDQLERVQRARLGQPLPPRIEVELKK